MFKFSLDIMLPLEDEECQRCRRIRCGPGYWDCCRYCVYGRHSRRCNDRQRFLLWLPRAEDDLQCERCMRCRCGPRFWDCCRQCEFGRHTRECDERQALFMWIFFDETFKMAFAFSMWFMVRLMSYTMEFV